VTHNLDELIEFARKVRAEKNIALGGEILEISRNSSALQIGFDDPEIRPLMDEAAAANDLLNYLLDQQNKEEPP
jgi:hypothetical protein